MIRISRHLIREPEAFLSALRADLAEADFGHELRPEFREVFDVSFSLAERPVDELRQMAGAHPNRLMREVCRDLAERMETM